MEIKHTVEILTKDIQDIEKLVRNLNNSPIPPRIELDLALSKLRNVYELLSMIRTDADEDTLKKDDPVAEEPVVLKPVVQTPVKEEAKAEESNAEETNTETPVQEEVKEEEPNVEESVVEKPVAEETKAEEPVEEAPVKEEAKAEEPNVEKPNVEESNVERSAKEEPVQTEIPLKEPVILAEKFKNDPSINEKASNTPRADLSSKITGQPIDNIGRNIGINDRFMIIRELFDGDNDSYKNLIAQLDSSSGSEEALGILEAKFPEQSDHEGYLLLTQLARRKFISG